MTEQRTSGRQRDPMVDERALAAVLELVAEKGIAETTMEGVAARAGVSKAALYRRWGSKESLIIDAIVNTGWSALVDQESTGDLREDLVRIIGDESAQATTGKLRVLHGLLAVINRDPELREVIMSALVEPRVAAIRRALREAVLRGDIASDIDVDLLSSTLPALIVYRLLIEGKPVSRPWQYEVVDRLILPAATAC